jgi:hypothetical protein
VSLGVLETTVGFTVVCLQIGMDEFYETVEIFGRDGLVLLVEIIYVAVEDFHKKFDGDRCVHAGVRNAKGALQALEHTLSVAIELLVLTKLASMHSERSFSFVLEKDNSCC